MYWCWMLKWGRQFTHPLQEILDLSDTFDEQAPIGDLPNIEKLFRYSAKFILHGHNIETTFFSQKNEGQVLEQ